jgi:hypothetical protein
MESQVCAIDFRSTFGDCISPQTASSPSRQHWWSCSCSLCYWLSDFDPGGDARRSDDVRADRRDAGLEDHHWGKQKQKQKQKLKRDQWKPCWFKVFANEDAAEKWFEENDPEGVAFEYPVIGADEVS